MSQAALVQLASRCQCGAAKAWTLVRLAHTLCIGPSTFGCCVWCCHVLQAYGIQFNSLLCLNNMPIKRFADWLMRNGKLSEYMALLVRACAKHACGLMLVTGTRDIMLSCFEGKGVMI
jgi:hypothetical protein